MKYLELLKTERGCPFCNISEEHTIIKNENATLTYSLAPYHPDHLLIVPNRHIEEILAVSPEELHDIDALQKKALELLHKLGYKNISILVREGEKTGRTIPHLHYHVIPDTVLGDLNHKGSERDILTEEEIKILMTKLRSLN